MTALDLEPEYNNESNIKGIFTIVDLNDEKSAVSSQEVIQLLLD